MSNQMKEINWSRAPTDATHYNQFACHWIKHLGNGSYQFLKGDEWEMGFGCMDSRYIERPEPEAWSGDGLPPAGIECEANWESTPKNVWHPVKVLANDEGVVVFRWKGGENKGAYSSYSQPYNFRPIRTPEQIAEEERRAAILEMKGHLSFSGYREAEQHCAALYDAGYRKVTP